MRSNNRLEYSYTKTHTLGLVMRSSRYVLMAASLLTFAACSSKDTKPDDALSQDLALARDLELANQGVVEPELKDLPSKPSNPTPAPAATVSAPKPKPAPAPAPVTPTPKPKPVPQPTPTPKPVPTPAPTPPAPTVTESGNRVESGSASGRTEGAATGTVAAGTTLQLAAGQKVCTNTNAVGDRFTASLTRAVVASNGVVIPVGTPTVVEISSLKKSEQSGDNMVIGLIIKSIRYEGKTYALNGEIVDADAQKNRVSNSKDVGKVAAGAVIGAILGRVVSGKGDKGKGTAIGAAAGAAVGAGVAEHQADYDACIPSGGKITLRLNQPLTVQSNFGARTTTPANNSGSKADDDFNDGTI